MKRESVLPRGEKRSTSAADGGIDSEQVRSPPSREETHSGGKGAPSAWGKRKGGKGGGGGGGVKMFILIAERRKGNLLPGGVSSYEGKKNRVRDILRSKIKKDFIPYSEVINVGRKGTCRVAQGRLS